ncbi:MAG TPA: CRISPR-associated protein Cas4 [Pseudobacteroides sp.]|jgi:CRISPR-associated exonuclease Cas4|nr:CRISPR-associated protein Cas4 [Pseudobacteroides sp.]
MKSSQSFFNEYEYYITPSEVIEFMYCPRFTYYMKCLGISQNEEKRFKVQMGREIHQKRSVQNKEYLRKKINSVKRESEVNILSQKWQIKGVVDEIHLLEDGTMAPLDYKYAPYDGKIFETYKQQIILYSLMIEEIYGKIVKRGFLVYCRDGNKLVEVEISESDKSDALDNLTEFKKVLSGYYPRATKYKARCADCCYKNICIS